MTPSTPASSSPPLVTAPGVVRDPSLWALGASETEIFWQAQPGMQNDLFTFSNASITLGNPKLECSEFLLGGMRGPGKTAALIAWMAEPVWHPLYRGMICRLESEAMKEFVDKAWQLYSRMGAVIRDKPAQFHFPSGAIIYLNHLKNDKSYEAMRGHEYHRVGIEEGAQIPKLELYLKAITQRSTIPELPCKSLVTTNPDGPGHDWLKKRFVEVRDKNGELIPPRTPIYDPIEERTRIFLPGSITDNKIMLKADPGFYKRMRTLPTHIQRAWIYGDWNTSLSAFFPEFRQYLDPHDRCEHAFHVVPAHHIPKWCHRWISIDWGFGHHSAVYWYAMGLDKRIHVYRELVVRGIGSDELGAEIAKLTQEDFSGHPEQTITIYLSHDAFSMRDRQHTVADQIRYGIETQLGPGSSFVLQMTEEEHSIAKEDKNLALEAMRRRIESQAQRIQLPIRKCNPDRVSGWSYCRRMLRWNTLYREALPDMKLAMELKNSGANGLIEYHNYMAMFDEKPVEVLPMCRIHDSCPILIETIPKLRPDKNNWNDVQRYTGSQLADREGTDIGDDPADSWRFGMMAYRDHENKMPLHIYLQEEVARQLPPDADINLKIQLNRSLAAKYDDGRPQLINESLPRAAMFARRIFQ